MLRLRRWQNACKTTQESATHNAKRTQHLVRCLRTHQTRLHNTQQVLHDVYRHSHEICNTIIPRHTVTSPTCPHKCHRGNSKIHHQIPDSGHNRQRQGIHCSIRPKIPSAKEHNIPTHHTLHTTRECHSGTHQPNTNELSTSSTITQSTTSSILGGCSTRCHIQVQHELSPRNSKHPSHVMAWPSTADRKPIHIRATRNYTHTQNPQTEAATQSTNSQVHVWHR